MKSYPWQSSYSDFRITPHMTRTVKLLIIIDIVLFILINLTPIPWAPLFGLVPRYVFAKFMIWQLATYMFLHLGLMHLVINMLMLWFFGPAIESAWGRKQFLFYYFFTGIGAALLSYITSPNSSIPIVGASGAIFGILVAYAMMFPNTVILLFFFFPMRIRHAVLVLAGINLLGALSSPQGGIAYFAHLGGALFGYIYLKSEWIRIHISYLSLSNLKLWWLKKRDEKKKAFLQDLDREVDIILDKISKYGIKSLSRKERKILERKSEKRE